MELEYGLWCTVRGHRYMIVDWTKNTVTVWDSSTAYGQRRTFDRSVVEDVSDFHLTVAERAAHGYAF
jgi:hypothetical protein